LFPPPSSRRAFGIGFPAGAPTPHPPGFPTRTGARYAHRATQGEAGLSAASGHTETKSRRFEPAGVPSQGPDSKDISVTSKYVCFWGPYDKPAGNQLSMHWQLSKHWVAGRRLRKPCLGCEPYKFKGCGHIHGPEPHEYIGLGDTKCPEPYDFTGSATRMNYSRFRVWWSGLFARSSVPISTANRPGIPNKSRGPHILAVLVS
jgi:hypothetical protein